MKNAPVKQGGKPIQGQGSQVLLHREQVVVSPLPPPEILKAYEIILPGVADRILAIAEEEQRERFRREDHRHEEALRGETHAFQATRCGQWLAFIAVLVLALAAVGCAVLNMPSVGTALAGATIVGVVTSFLRGHNKQGPRQGA